MIPCPQMVSASFKPVFAYCIVQEKSPRGILARDQNAAPPSIWPHYSISQMCKVPFHTFERRNSYYSTSPSYASFPFALATATAVLSSTSLALTLMQSVGSMLLSSDSRIAANAARPRYECRISVNQFKLELSISYKGL